MIVAIFRKKIAAQRARKITPVGFSVTHYQLTCYVKHVSFHLQFEFGSGNSNIDLVDLLSNKCNVFLVGNYLYIPYDSNGKRIQWLMEGNDYHIMLIDSKPLWDGNILVGYAGNRHTNKVELSVVLAFLDTYCPCPLPVHPLPPRKTKPQTLNTIKIDTLFRGTKQPET